MKTATIPSIRVDPALRKAAEGSLREGETLSSFVETSLHAQIEWRKAQDEFIARGLASRERAKANGRYIPAAAALETLEARLREAKGRA